MKFYLALFAVVIVLTTTASAATQVDLPGPPGSGLFGTSVRVLPNGNFVVTDPEWDQPSPPVANVGAVYLYTPEGALISTLRGSSPEDRVGSNGVFVLANGNFIVPSPNWDNGAASNAGAVTWGSAVSGFLDGPVVTVSAANSLVGSNTTDVVGSSSPTLLTNGHYVIRSATWDNGGVVNAGAVTWGNGFQGGTGTVSAANSLVGTVTNDSVGSAGVTALTNGHYVVRSPAWDNGATADVGAVTWGDGFTGISGPVTAANSLIGSTAADQVGSLNLTALTNGHYVVTSTAWDNGAVTNAGAVTWGNGNGGTTGPVSAANSLVGSTANDNLGNNGVTPLTSGNYVVTSTVWDNGAVTNAGAVTWGNGNGGTTGPVSAANSLVGSTANDQVGNVGVITLTNGNYVVISISWDNGAVTNAGAVTWGDGFAGTSGPVSEANSLVGSTANDSVGNNAITALTNGNYVVHSPSWDNGATADAGAATWGDGRKGVRGPVSAANSLVGTTANDQVGILGATALTNGHYVVLSPGWDNGAITNAGAATWGHGLRGIKGPVTAANSLHGSTAEDQVSTSSAIALTNGHYVVCSRFWDNGPVTNAGAATWGNGFTGIKGPVTAANSVHGTQNNDFVGFDGGTALPSGHYLVRSGDWNNGASGLAGAITWGDGFGGSSGPVTAANSLVGSTAFDQVGAIAPVVQADGSAVLRINNWDNGITSNAGAVTLFGSLSSPTGPIRSANSVLGTVASGGTSLVFGYDPARKQMIVGRTGSNLVTLFRGDRLRSLGLANQPAPGAADIAFGKAGSAAVSPDGVALADYSLTGSGAKGKNRALFALNPVTGTDLVLQSGTPLSALGGGLPGNATATALLGAIFNQPQRALFQATAKGTGITAANNRLLLLDNGASVQLLHRSGTPIPALGGAAIASFKEVLQSHDQNFLALTYKLKTGGGVTPANDEGLLFLDHSGSPGSNTIAAREGSPAFGGGTFGPFNGRAASAFGSTIYFTAALNIAGSTAPAVFSTTLNGVTTARFATTDDPAPASGGATYRNFPALTNAGVNALVKATLKNSPASENEGLYVLPTNLLLTRKGDDIGGGTFITRILRFWTAGPGQLILQVQLGKSQALLLRQNDGNYLTLLRTGASAPGVGSAKLKAISAVEVNPVSGRYAVLGTLSGSPANSNQALWTGDPTLGDNTPPALQDLRLPQLTLRKGNTYTTDATPQSVIRSIALKPAVDPTGAGSRGLAQALGASGDLAVYITGDRKLTELVLLDR